MEFSSCIYVLKRNGCFIWNLANKQVYDTLSYDAFKSKYMYILFILL